MYKLGTTKRFDKALKLCRKRGYPIEKLQKAINLLVRVSSSLFLKTSWKHPC